MDPGIFFVVLGIVAIVLWTTVLPKLDQAIEQRSRPHSYRRSEGWHRFQGMNRKQGLVFGAFLLLLGVIVLLSR